MAAPLSWQLATIAAIRDETPRVKTFVLDLPEWPGHLPGQHVDVRLTAEDGYEAQRSYSIASAPIDEPRLELTVEQVDDGEVSSFLHELAQVGDRLEVRGPIGGYFVWDRRSNDPLLLVAGGSGIVPLMAMLRQRADVGGRAPASLLYSSRTRDDVIYYDELDRLAARDDGLRVLHTLTRAAPPDWPGHRRRIDRELLSDALADRAASAEAFICGPTALVEAAARELVELGMPAARVRTERFGPSGS